MKLPVLLTLVCVLDSPGPNGPRTFPPRQFRAESGWELSIRPHDPDGLHGAQYALTRSVDGGPNAVVWEGSRPYTLRDPILTNRGWTYGTAYSYGASKRPLEPGVGWVVAIDPAGHFRIEDRIESGPTLGTWLGPILPFEALERIVVRTGSLIPDPWDEEWWIYDLSSGKRVASRRPFPAVRNDSGYPTAYTEVSDVVAVQDAPLLLVHGWRSSSKFPGDWQGAGDRWALFDLRGELAWSVDDLDDPAASDLGASVAAGKLRRGTIASALPSHFEIVRVRTKERLTFRVHEDPATHVWNAKQVARADWEPPASLGKK